MAGEMLKAAYIGGDFFAEESAVAEMEIALRWHSSQAEKVSATLAKVYQRREKDFNGLPLEAIQETTLKAIGNAQLVETRENANPYDPAA
jgi:hypothetical protein